MKVGDCCYIAGAMRKFRDQCYNFKRFFYWQVLLERSGYLVINPAEIDCKKALYSEWYFTEEDYREVLDGDKKLIVENADFLFVLKDWEGSEGVNEEIECAKANGIPIYYEDKPLEAE